MRKHTLSILLAVGAIVAAPVLATAQTSTTGAVRGLVEDENGDAIVGATVVATSPALQGTQAELTDDSGQYFISNLPPGVYDITVFYGDGKWSRQDIIVQLGKVAPVNLDINTGAAGTGETIVVEGTAPVIDQGSTKIGETVDEDYTRRIPTGRSYQGVLGAAAGSSGDTYGTSAYGSTSVENQYIVEGLNVTDPAFGGAVISGRGASTTTNLPNEFINETEIITGGYNAEYGRSTGAVVNVVTKSGGNEFHGSVFSYFSPGALSPEPTATPRAGSAVDVRRELRYDAQFGAEVGGPIIKDRLWFHVGLSPVLRSDEYVRTINSFVDRDGDGLEDIDPSTGFAVTEQVGESSRDLGRDRLQYHGKLSFAATPDHQGAVSVFGNPGSLDIHTGRAGADYSSLMAIDDGGYSASAKWTSKFLDNRTQVDAVFGFNGNREKEAPLLGGGETNRTLFVFAQPLAQYSQFEPGGSVPSACIDDSGDDPYPMITNCPVSFYDVGGIGFVSERENSRLSGTVKLTQRVQLAGHHQFKVGVDVEELGYDNLSRYTGNGRRYLLFSPTRVRVDRLFTPAEEGDMLLPCGEDFDGDNVGDSTCAFQADGLASDTSTRNIGAFVQDSWSILPNLTVNAGVRWEKQTAFVADHLHGTISTRTGEPTPETAFELNNMIAPRAGIIYDWTREGRSKVFAHWGRYYESVPMDINARAYGGEVSSRFTVPAAELGDRCSEQGDVLSGGTFECNIDDVIVPLTGGGGEAVVPNLRGQFMDEAVIGVEYEILEDTKAGVSYIHRTLGRVIEDVSVDGAATYIVANPGEAVPQSEIDALYERAAAERMAGNEATAIRLESEAASFSRVNVFDEPSRTYDGLEFELKRRFSRNTMVIASYTYSNLAGNFPGLFSPDTGQLDPNLTSMYDLPELMANRYGDLPGDTPHLFKLDGYYYLSLQDIGHFVFGGSLRAASGRPINTLGAHSLYGTGESYLLERGTAGRTEFQSAVDTRITYGRQVADYATVEVFFDVFNLLNQEPTLTVDEDYTFDDVNPIVGGDEEDLRHVKRLIPGPGAFVPTTSTAAGVELNPNYKGSTDLQNVRLFQFGLRVTF